VLLQQQGILQHIITSDRRQKNNITNIETALDKVKKLNGVMWDWNTSQYR
jgi:hypothetical protein